MNSPHCGAAIVVRGTTHQLNAAQTNTRKILLLILMRLGIAPHSERINSVRNLSKNAKYERRSYAMSDTIEWPQYQRQIGPAMSRPHSQNRRQSET
jgi:hypothetical protein